MKNEVGITNLRRERKGTIKGTRETRREQKKIICKWEEIGQISEEVFEMSRRE